MKFVNVCIDDSLSAFRQKDLKRKPSHSGVSPVFFSRCEWIVSELGDGYNLTFIFFIMTIQKKKTARVKTTRTRLKKTDNFTIDPYNLNENLVLTPKLVAQLRWLLKGIVEGRTPLMNRYTFEVACLIPVVDEYYIKRHLLK